MVFHLLFLSILFVVNVIFLFLSNILSIPSLKYLDLSCNDCFTIHSLKTLLEDCKTKESVLEELYLHSCCFANETDDKEDAYASICQTLCSGWKTSYLNIIELNNSFFEFDSSQLCQSWKFFHEPKDVICDILIYNNYAEKFSLRL